MLGVVRTERWLRIIGLPVWLVAGSTSFVRFAADFEPRTFAPWASCYVAFAVVFWSMWHPRASHELRVAGLATQAALGILLTFLGMPLFEGAALAIVAAQAPMVLPLWASIAWATAQIVPLWIVLSHTYRGAEITKSITSYLGFSAFALAAVHLFEAEHRARVELDRALRELVATRTLLAESTRVAERVRISRELHDVLGHHLAALAIHLDLARRTADERSRGALEETLASVQRMLGDVRAAMQELRAGDAIDLGRALRAMVGSLPGLTVQLDMPDELTVADPERAHAAFRCVQEAITNVLKHAGASKVRVVVVHEAGSLELRVEDDGHGTGRLEPGGGLRGMRERIEGVGGTLEITGTPGGGTTVVARLPVREVK
jgi:signal transduction histidine kinase